MSESWKGLDRAILRDAGVTTNAAGVVRVPYRRQDGEEHNAKLFGEHGRSWWESSGRSVIPLGLETLGPPQQRRELTLLVCEGESDCFAVRAAYKNLEAVRVIALPGAMTWQRAWAPTVKSFQRVFVLGDGDDAGRNMGIAVKRDVPHAVACWGMPDGYDVRDLIRFHGVQALDDLLGDAEDVQRFVDAFLTSPDLATYERFVRRHAGAA